MGIFGGRLEVIVAKQHANLVVGGGQRQFQPILHQMFLVGARPAHHALGGLALLYGAAVGGDPIVVLVTPIQVFNEKAGNFTVIDFPEPGAGQPDAALRLVGALRPPG